MQNPMGAKNNDSTSEKQAIVKFYTMEYRKCGNSNSKNDSRPCVGASAFLKSVDFKAFAVNIKTIAPKQKLYQFRHAIWWGTIPMPVATFLEEYDFSEKTIIPFASHEGSGLGSGPSDIKKLCSDAKVKDGFAIRGSDVKSDETKETVADFVKGMQR